MSTEKKVPEIHQLLELMVSSEASDLHLCSGNPPYLRVHGDVVPVEGAPVLTPDDTRRLIDAIMPAKNLDEFAAAWDTDFGYEIEGVGRFRANVFVDHLGPGAVLRSIPTRIRTAEELNLPPVVRDLCNLSKGLVVVTGPTGSGKSTTLAAMIDLMNRTRRDHLITIEDPIEFVHRPIKSLINQREVHSHTKSFSSALRAALREDPDIVMVGELRDLETIETALETAETGHLVIGSLHTTTAPTTVDRLIDKFPANRQNQIRTMLADSLKAVIAQTLCRCKPKGRTAALEILVVNHAISALIRDGKTFQIESAMQTGRKQGMRLLNDELFRLVREGNVEPREAYMRAVDKEDIAKRFKDAGVDWQSEAASVPALALHAPEDAGRIRAQVARYRESLRLNPDDEEVLNNLAWTLATCPHDEIRQGNEALQVALHAYDVSNGTNPEVADTLAAAYAETGDFDQALAFSRRGVELARRQGNTALVENILTRQCQYDARRPVREMQARAA
jgi:twitching motility protein PilT